MEKITAVNSSVIKWAREVSHYSISDVSEYLDKDPKIILDWESGVDYPTYAQLEKLSELYRKPLAVFFFPDVPKIQSLKASCRTLPESAYSKLSFKIIRKMNEARAMQLNLCELHNNVNPAKVNITKLVTPKNFNDLLVSIRNILGVSLQEQKRNRKIDDAFEMWRERFVMNGVYVFKDAFRDDSISGFCLYDNEFPVIYINNSMSFARQIFTLFHELYHLISHTSGIDKIDDDYFSDLNGGRLNIERDCNKFAGAFLVPPDDLLNEVKGKYIDDDLVNKLAILYKVSRDVISRSLLNLGLITNEEYEEKHAEYVLDALRAKDIKKEKSGGDSYYTKISYLGYGYLHLVFDKYRKNQIDIYQLSEYTKTKVEHLPKLEMKWGWRVRR